MEYEKTLIDKAAKMCGNDEALAKRLGTSRPNISLMRSGKRSVSPVMAAELADIAGEDVNVAVNRALLMSVQGTEKEKRLREILGKALAAGEAAKLAISYKNVWKDSTQPQATSETKGKRPIHCIYQKLRRLAGHAGLRKTVLS